MKHFAMIFAIVVLTALATGVLAQPPDTLWTRTYGGFGTDYGYSVQQTTDGGFIVAGYTASIAAPDYYLVKTDSNGDTLWTRTYGGFAPETAYCIEQTSDEGYIVAGYTFSYGAGAMDVYLVKTNSTGDTLWTRTYGGGNIDIGQCVQQTTDGGYILVGATSSYGAGSDDFYLIKTNSTGDTLWTRTYGGSGVDAGYSVQQTTDGGYIVVGATQSYGAGSNDVYLIKTSSTGDTLWAQTYGGSNSDQGFSVQQTTDGGYILAGVTASYGGGSNDVYLIKTNSTGDTLWTRTFGALGVNDFGQSVQQTTDGGYIVAGYTDSYGAGSIDVYLVKTNSTGDTQWSQTHGGIESDQGYSVQQTTDGGYIVAGQTMSYGAGNMDFYLIRLEAEAPPLALTLTPHNPPIQIPSGGGSFMFGVEIENTTAYDLIADAWIDITPPGGPVVPLIVRLDIIFLANITISRDSLTQNVPSRAPAGTYVYACGVGEVMGTIIDLDQFTFEKLAGDGGISTVNNWNLSGWEEEVVQVSAPAEFSLSSAYPNPFNPATTLSFALPEAQHTRLDVFNLRGQLVATLVNGYRQAGYHEVSFDAASLASGLYIYRIEAGNFIASGKMVLMK